MGENAKKIGDKLEGFGKRLYERFGWNELTRDVEIACTNSSHKTEKAKAKRTHGVDLYHSYFDPYKNMNIGVVTECKNYGWDNINPGNLQKWFNQLLWTIECAQTSVNLTTSNEKCDGLNTGILLVHTNDGRYDDAKFREYLGQINYKTKRSTVNIFVAGNKEIEIWDSMFEYIEKNFNGKDNSFKFYYPSILGSSLVQLSHVSLYQLYSSFIFAENKTEIETIFAGKPMMEPITQRIVFSFDKISETSFLYIFDMFKALQLESADEYIFAFYPENKDDVKLIEEKFMKYACEELKMSKVKYIILDNRNLSPIDTK
ncbi:MAG TPA: hypothetical protein VIK86_06275 [Candidatus Paceibacterota bacterium]